MSNKPDWKDAPKWANHLWTQSADDRYTWSETKEKESKALYSTHADNKKNRYHLWPECWAYVEPRP